MTPKTAHVQPAIDTPDTQEASAANRPSGAPVASPEAPDLIALVGSRIAHDLNNPLGAISNGVELLGLVGQVHGPELELVGESIEMARKRIQRFRIAFGAAAPGQTVAFSEVKSVFANPGDSRRPVVKWGVTQDLLRREAKALCLALMCLESAMPWGGMIVVDQTRDGWHLTAQAERFQLDPELWRLAAGDPPPEDLAANAVHFTLFGRELFQQGRELTFAASERTLQIAF